MRIWTRALAALACTILNAAWAPSQTLSPPIAEYRRKADGILTLTNNGDAPLAAILETRGFTVDPDGNLQYGPPDPNLHVEFGSSSFVIPAHQLHYVFYKASCPQPPCWFAILNTLTQAAPITQGLRINIVLPHLVYIYQKAKFKRSDVRVEVSRGDRAAGYQLKFENLDGKLERVESIRVKGFRSAQTYGGFPLFPHQVRVVSIEAGTPLKKPEFHLQFGGGLHFDVPLPEQSALDAGTRQ